MSKKTKKTEWSKNCPECGFIQYYTTRESLRVATKKNIKCRSCSKNGFKHTDDTKKRLSEISLNMSDETKLKMSKAALGKVISKETRKKMSKAALGKVISKETRKKISISKLGKRNPMYGKSFKHTDEAKQKISKKNSGKNNPRYGKPVSAETRKKLRISRIMQIKIDVFNGSQAIPSYNKSSIPIIEAKAKELGITDLQHAENGGEYHIKELGYFVDGYSKEKNIVIEYDEPHHKRQVEKDQIRQKEITEYLGCEFIRITEDDI